MKASLYWSYATRALARGGQRTLLAIFCVAVGVLAVVALQLVGAAVIGATTGNIRTVNGADLHVYTNNQPFSHDQLAVFDHLQTQGTITTYTAVSSHGGQSLTAYDASGTSGHVVFYTLVAIDPARFPLGGGALFDSPAGGSLARLVRGPSVVILRALATSLGVRVGDTIVATSDDGRAATVTVGGIIQNTLPFVNFSDGGGVMLMAQEFYAGLPSTSLAPYTYSDVFVDVPGHTDAAATAVAKTIKQQLPDSGTTTAAQANQQNQQGNQQIRYFLQVTSLLALLIGGVGISNTIAVLLRRRRTEIAMLKTAGYQRRDLYLLFGLETGLLGLVGGVLGAAAGAGASYLVQALFERAFAITLHIVIDPLTMASGVAIGVFTALVFGLMPIVRASGVRPLAVLRELPESGVRIGRVVTTLLLGALLVGLFYLLALSILGNPVFTLFVVGGAGGGLVVLALVFYVVVFVVSKLRVPEGYRWWSLLLVAVELLLAFALSASAQVSTPANLLRLLLLALAVIGLALPLVPRLWRENLRIALRNMGRQRVRSVTTLIALFVGIFAIGLTLTLGQNIQSQFAAAATKTAYNGFIIAGSGDKAAVDQQLGQLKDVQRELISPFMTAQPDAINGVPAATIILQTPPAPKKASNNSDLPENPQAAATNALARVGRLQGYDLASGQHPDLTALTLAKGDQDAQKGRALGTADAGTSNVWLPIGFSQWPLSLKLGDKITLVNGAASDTTGSAAGGASGSALAVTLDVVGFYDRAQGAINEQFGIALTDNSVVTTLSAGRPLRYGYYLRLSPSHAGTELHQIQVAVPTAQTLSIADAIQYIDTLLNNLALVLEAVASLALLAGIISIANTVALAMLERRRELGILKAIGHTSSSVLGEVLVENGIVGLVGGLLATLLATLITGVLVQSLFNFAIAVDATRIAIGVTAAAIALCMALAALVAWSATRVRPIEVLRYE